METFVPIKKCIPKWFKDTLPSYGITPNFFDKKSTFKACTPFIDALTTGYALTLPGDLLCEYDDNQVPFFTWGQPDVTIVTSRSVETLGKLPWPQEFYPAGYAWKLNTFLSLPKGYSFLVTHPLNRVDLPFYTLSGVVDGYDLGDGNIPFFLKTGFTGLIPIGTPIAQIIPFKRENWKTIRDIKVKEKADINRRKATSVFKGWYKSNIWKKKTYE